MHAIGNSLSLRSDDMLPEPWQLVRAARGFSALFWGLPISTMLYFDAMEIRVLTRLQLPAYVFGMIVVVVGLVNLHRARFYLSAWRRHSRGGLFAGLLILYMAPIVFWYRILPPLGPHYAINITCLLVCVIWLLLNVNHLAEDLGVITADPDLTIESRLCGWSVVLLMAIPIVGMLAIGSFLSVRYKSSLLSEIRTLRETLPIWTHIFFLVPLSLTMIITWKAKEQCLDLLRESGPPDNGT